MRSGESEKLQEQLLQVLRKGKINIVFQPIVSLRDGAVLGYEALSRGPEGTPLYTPDALFGTALECGKLWDLEQLCRTKALESAYRSNSDIKLFLNVNPHVIHDEQFKQGFTREYLNSFGINPENIFFEITEKSAVSDLTGFKKTIEHYKKQNYKIAIDDAGAGYSGLNMITDIHPHYIKLDMNLVRDIDADGYKKALVASLYEFCRLANVALIAEGVETERELSALIGIGVHYAQGFFIQRPDSRIKPIDGRVLDSIRSENAKKNHLFFHCLANVYIGNLCRPNPTVSPSDMALSVYALFLQNDGLMGVAVTEDGAVTGIVTKTRIDQVMGGQFGYSLHAKRPIAQLMDSRPLVTDFQTPIDTVSKLAMSRPARSLYDFIIVTLEGKYHGIVTIKDLLEKTMEIEVSNARHQNPLSGLPGNLLIENALTKCTASSDPFTVLYVDIDNFKAYNDVYGFENGDNVIRFMAALLEEAVPRGSFIGHLGGDDFLAILSSYDAEPICRELIRRFDSGIREFYSETDLLRGFVTVKNRKGEDDQFPVMSVSIAGVSNRQRSFRDAYHLSEFASGIKKKCKQVWNSCYRVD